MDCPLSMSRDMPVECSKNQCSGYVGGECFLNKITLSLYFIAKNTKESTEGYYEDADI